MRGLSPTRLEGQAESLSYPDGGCGAFGVELLGGLSLTIFEVWVALGFGSSFQLQAGKNNKTPTLPKARSVGHPKNQSRHSAVTYCSGIIQL